MKVNGVALILPIYLFQLALSAPLEEDRDPEDRRFHNRRKKPCRKDASGRTFFDWNYSNFNINNYFNDCGGYGQYPVHKPIGGGGHGGHHQHQHGGGFLGGPHNGGGFFGGNNGNKGGLFGLGLFDWFGGGNSRPINRPKPQSTEAPEVTESQNEDDDYQDDKPVNEDIDEVVLDRNQHAQLGYNPLFGNYDVTNFNPTKVVKRVNKEFNSFFRPFYDLF
ncbi:hypothetical protein RN001_014140 [Aquatica leii]|uniref:Uncharacterized protein n=1 Tax=Aquatica leii TaxID=1421715 RepID=A0AAN7NX40_9COLE|nr:hypothetical protein RN001_014140 [Aquatica leii]